MASARAAYRTVVPRTGDSTTKKNGLARRGLQVLQIRGLPSLCNVVAQSTPRSSHGTSRYSPLTEGCGRPDRPGTCRRDYRGDRAHSACGSDGRHSDWQRPRPDDCQRPRDRHQRRPAGAETAAASDPTATPKCWRKCEARSAETAYTDTSAVVSVPIAPMGPHRTAWILTPPIAFQLRSVV
jgi:hypothetical protein